MQMTAAADWKLLLLLWCCIILFFLQEREGGEEFMTCCKLWNVVPRSEAAGLREQLLDLQQEESSTAAST
jgi:hypothetical protein